MTKFFQNYEHIKLVVTQPDYVNLLITILFVALIIATIKKDKFEENVDRFLSKSHTDQLRGIAIFFVVLGHLWVHVSKIKPQVILSGDSVALFLVLSGFGLAMSTLNKRICLKDFCFKRIKRVMVPYWLVTIIILSLDYLILDRTLKLDSLLMTVLGINTRIELTHLDYVRWFVTFVLLWYFLFYIFLLNTRSSASSPLLLIIALLLVPLNYYFLHFEWYQFFSFPAGILLAIHKEKLMAFRRNNKTLSMALSIFGIFYVLFYKILMSHQGIYLKVTELIPNILLVYYSEWNSLILCFSSLILTGHIVERGFNSNILLFLGKYSYEIFLLHGVFLIKYNPIIKDQSIFLVSFQFSLLFISVSIVSVLIYKAHNSFYDKKPT